jgi:hypothetical protein
VSHDCITNCKILNSNHRILSSDGSTCGKTLRYFVPHKPVERNRASLTHVVSVQHLGEPAQVLVVDEEHVSRPQESPGALVLGACEHREPQVLGVLPLRSLLAPHEPAHADRGHDDHATQEPLPQQMREAGERDGGLPQTHV